MKIRIKSFLMCVCLSVLLFCFGGCEPLGGYADDYYIRHGDDGVVPPRPGIEPTPAPVDNTSTFDDDWIYEDDAFDDYISKYYGMRTIYTANAKSNEYLNTTDAFLLADRQKFNSNAQMQYYYMAKYILYNLVDHYATTVDESNDTYTFYANTSLLPEGTLTQTVVEYNPTLHALSSARIAKVIQNDPTWTCSLSIDSSYDYINYLADYLPVFVPYLQIRLMETALGVTTPTSINLVVNLATNQSIITQVNTIINNLVKNIYTLGISDDVLSRNNVKNIIQNDIIGENAYNANLANYNLFLNSVINGFYDNIAPNFASYNRNEFCDVDSATFYDAGTKAEPSKLSNIEYQEYQSASFFYKEGQEALANTYFDLYVDSAQDIVLDVYCLYLKAGVGQKIEYAFTLHTDSTKNFYYSPYDENDELNLNEEVTNYNSGVFYDGLTVEQRDEDEFLSKYLNPDSTFFGTNGYANPMQVDSGSFGAILARTNINDVWYLPNNVNKNGEVVDLSDIMVYAPADKDGVVLVFDIQYNGGGTTFNHDDYDYSFKYIAALDGSSKEEIRESFENIDE